MASPHNADRQTLFTRAASPTARLMLYGLLAIVLMAMDFRGQYVERIRNAASLLAVPVYKLIEMPFRFGGWMDEQITSRATLVRQNRQLSESLMAMQAQLQKLNESRAENQRLRDLLGAGQQSQEGFLYAELLSIDLDPFSHRVMISGGPERGIFVGQPVIDAYGVVGQVEAVLPGTARVRLISDANHALPVQIGRTGLRSIVYGSGDTQILVLPTLPFNADVQAGDLLFTSGLGDRFPAGYPVGEIMSVQRDPGQTFARAYARPTASLDRGREVLLLTGSTASESPVSAVDDDQ